MKYFWLIFAMIPSLLFADGFHVTLENDVFAGTDRHYTHGTRFFYFRDDVPSWADNLFKGKNKRWGVGLAQYMYTPSDIEIVDLIENERPYGGWLYTENILFVRDYNVMDIVGIDVGITGEDSGSKSTQKIIHKIVDSDIPQGWDNQIEEELGINLLYQKKYRWRWEYMDIIPRAGGSLGNIYTYLNAGVIIRAGYNIPDNFGYLRMEPTARATNLGAYVFASADGRLIGRNIFLDGNTFEDSHSVDKEYMVGDLSVGTGIIFRNFELIYGSNFRSKEFKGQDKSNRFSTLILSWGF